MAKSLPRQEVEKLLDGIQNRVEELLSWLGEDLTVGDGGVAEAIIDIENAVMKAQGRLEKQKLPVVQQGHPS
jgi:hypothetical protein